MVDTTNMPHDEWEYAVVTAEIFVAVGIATWYIRKNNDQYKRSISIIPKDQLWKSTGLSPTQLTFFRAVVFLYFVSIQCYQLINHGVHCLAFYTTWNFILQIVYFGLMSLLSWRIQTGRRVSPAWVHATFILFDICFACCFLVAVVLWLILYPLAKRDGTASHLLNVVSYTQHGINVLILCLEFGFNHLSVQPLHGAFLVYWPTTYALFAWIVHGSTTRGFWPYPFMKVREPYSPLWYLGLLFAHLCFFGIVYGASQLKRRFVAQKSRNGAEYQNLI